jgi:hypothetical protein
VGDRRAARGGDLEADVIALIALQSMLIIPELDWELVDGEYDDPKPGRPR